MEALRSPTNFSSYFETAGSEFCLDRPFLSESLFLISLVPIFLNSEKCTRISLVFRGKAGKNGVCDQCARACAMSGSGSESDTSWDQRVSKKINKRSANALAKREVNKTTSKKATTSRKGPVKKSENVKFVPLVDMFGGVRMVSDQYFTLHTCMKELERLRGELLDSGVSSNAEMADLRRYAKEFEAIRAKMWKEEARFKKFLE